MCYKFSGRFSKTFTEIFLFLCMLRFGPSGISVNATSLNSSEEIKNIFSLPDVSEPVLKETSKTGNFAEGGLINLNLTQYTSRTSSKHSMNITSSSQNVSHNKSYLNESISSTLGSTVTANKSHSLFESSTTSTLMPTKLTETGSNLFLGVPEVVHINGTSSIKPRKGVHYIKIVPRKGVDNDSSHDILENESCLQLTENECYNATQCNCCKEGNVLEKKIKEQVLVNCKICKPINKLSQGKEICKNICCNVGDHDIGLGSTTQDSSNNYLSYKTVTEKNKQDIFNISTQSSEKMEVKGKNVVLMSKKNSKLKPSLTKVPYDVEVVTELLSKTQQKVFVPIIVSIFLLPLIGILLFFLWKRTKEYWDKRYYKRMDFLIDGIYND